MTGGGKAGNDSFVSSVGPSGSSQFSAVFTLQSRVRQQPQEDMKDSVGKGMMDSEGNIKEGCQEEETHSSKWLPQKGNQLVQSWRRGREADAPDAD